MKLFRSKQDALTCREALRVLQSYLDGEAEAKLAARMASHLEGCNSCTFEAENLKTIKSALQRLKLEVNDASLKRLEQYVRNIESRSAN